MFEGLKKTKANLEEYQRLVLIFPRQKEPIGMVEGFLHFCRKIQVLIIVSSIDFKIKKQTKKLKQEMFTLF